MKCPYCKKDVPKKKFCEECGRPIHEIAKGSLAEDYEDVQRNDHSTMHNPR